MRLFFAVPRSAWVDLNLRRSLEDMGHELVRFDFPGWPDDADPAWRDRGKPRTNERLLAAFNAAQRERPLDLFFGYFYSVGGLSRDHQRHPSIGRANGQLLVQQRAPVRSRPRHRSQFRRVHRPRTGGAARFSQRRRSSLEDPAGGQPARVSAVSRAQAVRRRLRRPALRRSRQLSRPPVPQRHRRARLGRRLASRTSVWTSPTSKPRWR